VSKDLPKAPPPRGFVFELEPVDGKLTLFARHHPDYGGICVDWSAADVQRRVRAGRKQLLARAVGLHKRADPEILDATGGMGRDAFTLAALGATVTVAEREPLIAQLLLDGWQRALADPGTTAAAQRVQIVEGDAREQFGQRHWDVIYLDPMFPGHERDARSKKQMQFLRELAGNSAEDDEELLARAIASASGRVVVKRPRSAPRLGSAQPAYELSGTQARFDVYLAAANSR
jgi:16S rRNA (guanine1516-N2)-methyltransferase